jgi:hypothetical protein
MQMREEVTDRYGNVIYLTDERWQHIVKNHFKLNGHRAEVLSTVRSGKRKQDPKFLDKYYYTKSFHHTGKRFNKLEVVVVCRWQLNKPNNFIFTAYPLPR